MTVDTLKMPKALSSRWLTIKLAENEAAIWSVEKISVYAQRVVGDWMLAHSESNTPQTGRAATKISSLPLDLNWKRWALEHEAKEVRFWPAFPDRALVVKTRIPVIVPPKTSVELFINLPIWLEVSVKQEDKYYTLEKIAPSKLSNTWYGTHFEGELCYALKSRARRSLEDLSEDPLRAVCLFTIKNRSEVSLPVEKIRINPSHLSIYLAKRRLWTNSVSVTFEGGQEHSKLHYESEAPKTLSKAELIREADEGANRGSIIDRLLFRAQNAEE